MRNLISIGKSLSTAALLACLFLFLSACHGNTSEPRETRVYVVGPLQTIDADTGNAVMRKLRNDVEDKEETTIILLVDARRPAGDVTWLLQRMQSEGYRKVKLELIPKPAAEPRFGDTRESAIPQTE